LVSRGAVGSQITVDEDQGVFRKGSAGRILAIESTGLSNDDRALLVALGRVEAASGVELSAEDETVLKELEGQLTGYDAEELARAVTHVVTTKPRKGRKLDWGELKRLLRKKPSVK